MRLTSDRGNAILEFILIGLIAQLVIFGSLVSIGSTFRSQIAAQVIARQTLRTVQLTGSIDEATRMSNQVLALFGIPTASSQLAIANTCADNGLYVVKVKVRGSSFVATGFCLG